MKKYYLILILLSTLFLNSCGNSNNDRQNIVDDNISDKEVIYTQTGSVLSSGDDIVNIYNPKTAEKQDIKTESGDMITIE